jgi:hypothetical protein
MALANESANMTEELLVKEIVVIEQIHAAAFGDDPKGC